MPDLAIPLRFDLARGSVRYDGAARVALAPAALLVELLGAASDDARTAFAFALGAHAAAEASRRAGGAGAALDEPPEDAVAALSIEVALLGLGSLWVERWGEAVVVVLESFPLGDSCIEAFVCGIFSGFAQGAEALVLDRSGDTRRLLLAGSEGRSRVRALMEGGAAWADAIARASDAQAG